MKSRAVGLLTTGMAASALLCAGLWAGPAGSAHADPTDSSFLAALDQDGLHYQSPASVISYAKDICGSLRTGRPATEVVNAIRTDNPKLTDERTKYFVAAAVAYYCPDQNTGAKPPT